MTLLVACAPSNAAHLVPNPTPAWIAVDIAGMTADFRGSVYDAARDCLWIVSRHGTDAGVERATLLRTNLADRDTFRTSVDLPADGFIKGLVAVDGGGTVWMAWGRTLTEFDPQTEATRSWTRPAYTGLWPADGAGLYGNMVGLAIDPNGEIWMAAYEVSALFGFNPGSSSWDRTVNLPFLPTDETTIAIPSTGTVSVSGVAIDGKFTPVLAIVTTSSHVVRMMPTQGTDYLLAGTDQIVSVDHSGTLARISLTDGTRTVLATRLGLSRNPASHFVIDSAGDLWFPFSSYRSLGVARLDMGSGVITRYPFPYIDRPGQASTTPNTCPTGALDCIPPDAIALTQVDGLALDAQGDLWVVTEAGSHANPTSLAIPSPICELTDVG